MVVSYKNNRIFKSFLNPNQLFLKTMLGAALRRACTTLGQRVRVDAPDGVLRGTAVDIAPGLVLRGADGTMRTVDAGDVSHVRTDGAVD